mmetsp:Transcript_56628/g.132624  ORF Transcript_56628/g.132624 Transcript_56628/m.132624 type:complete len:307 (-) Transcript_56628:2082-3002(-)
MLCQELVFGQRVLSDAVDLDRSRDDVTDVLAGLHGVVEGLVQVESVQPGQVAHRLCDLDRTILLDSVVRDVEMLEREPGELGQLPDAPRQLLGAFELQIVLGHVELRQLRQPLQAFGNAGHALVADVVVVQEEHLQVFHLRQRVAQRPHSIRPDVCTRQLQPLQVGDEGHSVGQRPRPVIRDDAVVELELLHRGVDLEEACDDGDAARLHRRTSVAEVEGGAEQFVVPGALDLDLLEHLFDLLQALPGQNDLLCLHVRRQLHLAPLAINHLLPREIVIAAAEAVEHALVCKLLAARVPDASQQSLA